MAPKPFKPPRPSGSTTKPKSGSSGISKSKPAASAKAKDKSKDAPTNAKKPARNSTSRISISSSSSSSSPEPSNRASPSATDSDDPFASSSRPARPPASKSAGRQRAVTDDDGEAEEVVVERKEYIPQKLVQVVMHECFKEKGTRIGREANVAVGRYLDTFVREALARAAFSKVERAGGMDEGGQFLEVEDLERLAPQLILDF